MKKGFFARMGIFATILIALFLISECNRSTPEPDKGAQPQKTQPEKVSVRMKWFIAGTMTGWFAGREQGIFTRHGIDLTINPGGPDNSSVKLVAAGTDMFGVAGADEVLLARAKGIPIVAIGVLFKESPICFISKKSNGIQTPKDWAGKTVEVSYGSNAEVQYRALVAKYGVKKIKEVPYTFNLAPFIEDKVDVSVAYKMDQAVTLQRKGIELSIITAKEHGVNPYGDVVITTEKTLQEHPDLVKNFMAAVIESSQWAIEHPKDAVASLVKNATELKADNESLVWQETIPFLTAEGGAGSIGLMRSDRWTDTMNQLVEFKALDKPVDVNAAFKNVVTGGTP